MPFFALTSRAYNDCDPKSREGPTSQGPLLRRERIQRVGGVGGNAAPSSTFSKHTLERLRDGRMCTKVLNLLSEFLMRHGRCWTVAKLRRSHITPVAF